MSGTSLDLSQIRTDALTSAASFRTLIGVYSTADVDGLIAAITALTSEDIDTLAEINAIIGDADVASVSYVDGLAANYATAAQGALADTALQSADITSGAITPGTGDIDFDNLGGGGAESPLTLTASTSTEVPLTLEGHSNSYTGNHPLLRFKYGDASTLYSQIADGSGSLRIGSGTDDDVLNIWYGGSSPNRVTIGRVGPDGASRPKLTVYAPGISGTTYAFVAANGYSAYCFTIADDGATLIDARQASTVPLTIKLAASATGNAMELNSVSGSGGDLAKITAAGAAEFSSLNLSNVPTSDPTVAGALWNDSGTLKISAG